MLDLAEKRADLPDREPDACPKCGCRKLATGYGLAGGGCGVYTYCEACGTLTSKIEDYEE